MTILDKLRVISRSEFDDVTDEEAGAFIALADLQVASDLCDTEKRELIVAYLTAHMLTISRRKLGASGDIASLAEGKLSITYNNAVTNIKTGLNSTIYGKEYDRLSKSCIISARVAAPRHLAWYL